MGRKEPRNIAKLPELGMVSLLETAGRLLDSTVRSERSTNAVRLAISAVNDMPAAKQPQRPTDKDIRQLSNNLRVAARELSAASADPRWDDAIMAMMAAADMDDK